MLSDRANCVPVFMKPFMLELETLCLWSTTTNVVSSNDYIYSHPIHEPLYIRSLSAFPTTFVRQRHKQIRFHRSGQPWPTTRGTEVTLRVLPLRSPATKPRWTDVKVFSTKRPTLLGRARLTKGRLQMELHIRLLRPWWS